ncbi:lamin-C-like [Papaver somniferum]|uniref:lamin-C-like n=1 Tax=Papaver somniferum TaxID=3469 RepID=UPI000E6FC7C6|nr:lamin-C-like [Papaver somniferum]
MLVIPFQDYALAIAQQPSSSDAASIARISSLEGGPRKTQRSLEACLWALERDNNAAKVAEEGRKAVDSVLATESSKSIVKQMVSLDKECDEAFRWKEGLILRQKEDISLVEKRLSAQEVIRKKYHADFEDACASLTKVTAEQLENVYRDLSYENESLRIDVDDLRTERDTLLDDLDMAEVDLAEAQHSLKKSHIHAGGLQEKLVGANAKIINLEGQISQLEISRQFDPAARFKTEALQRPNDQLSAQLRKLRQKSTSDMSAQASEMEARFKRSAIDYINNAFAEAELQAEVVTFPRLPYP